MIRILYRKRRSTMAFYSVDELRHRATGRWAEILTSAGIPARILDGRNHPCPKCGGRDRFAAFPDFDQRGAVHCRYCFTRGSIIRPGDGVQTLRWWLGTDFLDTLQHLADALGYSPASDSASPVPRPLSPLIGSTPAQTMSVAIDSQTIEDHTEFARQSYHRIDTNLRARLARRLNVATFSLTSLRVGITADAMSSTWPMRDADGQIIGVRIVALPLVIVGR